MIVNRIIGFKKLFFLPIIFILAGCLTVRLPKIEIKNNGPNDAPMGWGDMVQRALLKNPDILSAKAFIESAARSRDSAAGDYLPSVTGVLSRSESRTTGTGRTSGHLSRGISADQPLFTGLGTTGDFISARKDLQSARWNYQDVSSEVRFRLRSVYVELLKLDTLLEVTQRIAERRRQNAELIQLRYEAGREHLGSAMRAKAIAEQAYFEVRQITRRVESQSLRLGREIGGDFELPVLIDGDLEKILPLVTAEAKPDFAGLAEITPAVQKAVKTAESMKAAVLSAQSVLWPQVNGTYDYAYSGTRESDLRDESSLGIDVSLPFFNGGKNIAGIRKAKAEYELNLQNARAIRDETVAELAEAWTQMIDASEQVKVRRSFLEAARKRSEIVRSEYTAGLVNFQDFDIAEQDIADSEKNFVEALAFALTQEAVWERVKGATLEQVMNGV